MGLLSGDLCPPCWDVICFIRDWTGVFRALANRTTELCQMGASQPKWARIRVASPGFDLGWQQGCALVPGRTTELCQTGASQPEWARGRVTSVGFELTRQGCALVPDRTTELCQTGASQSEWARGRVASVGFRLTRLCSGAWPYHRTVPDGGIIAGMGQG